VSGARIDDRLFAITDGSTLIMEALEKTAALHDVTETKWVSNE
jgi:hypothetical protein